MNKMPRLFTVLAALLMLVQACNLPAQDAATEPAATPPIVVEQPAATEDAPPTALPVVQHLVFPATAPNATLFYDAESSGTAPEKRAPYGDSYGINRLERPFLQDMTYIPDLDIRSFSLSQDGEWLYVSIGLIGTDPNNSLGIEYGVEFDIDKDGFGDFVIVAVPPFTSEWTAQNVRVFTDTNNNTSGISPARSDAPFNADGYETMIFDGSLTTNEDPDLAWVRSNAGPNTTVQFAVKQSLIGRVFMFGVFADAGLKDVSMLDYVDRFTEDEAGSPIRNKAQYPLKSLHSFDNTCREAIGFKASGYEPMVCPVELTPTPEPGEPKEPPPSTQIVGCTNPGQYSNQSSCQAAGCSWQPNPAVLIAVVYYCTFP
jgi:hypothetical protein